MKKLTALLALFLLLALLAQGACAAVKVEIWPRISRTIPQDRNTLYGTLSPSETSNQYEIRLSALNDDDTFRNNLRDSLHNQLNKYDIPLDSGYTRKALYVDMTLWHKSDSNSDFMQTYDNPNVLGEPLNPVVPLSAFISEGTTFKNLRIFHAKQDEYALIPPYSWDDVERVIHIGTPEFNQDGESFNDKNTVNTDGPLNCESDYHLRLSVGHFSPFAIVWDEPASGVLAAIDALPDTGDRSSPAPWLLLLGGACALLALRRRSQRAS